jgi:hypothetical protein
MIVSLRSILLQISDRLKFQYNIESVAISMLHDQKDRNGFGGNLILIGLSFIDLTENKDPLRFRERVIECKIMLQ